MSNRKRNIQILFCVTPEEKKLIRQKMILSKTRNMGAYLRKMAIDGYIINTDTTPIKQVYEEMHRGTLVRRVVTRRLLGFDC